MVCTTETRNVPETWQGLEDALIWKDLSSLGWELHVRGVE